MTRWKKVRRRAGKQVRDGLEEARRYARRIEAGTEPQRRRLGAEARRRAPSFAAFAIATALELMRQRRGPGREPGRLSRFFRTALLVGIAAFVAALVIRRKR